MKVPSPPAPSAVDKLIKELLTIAPHVKTDYRMTWDESFDSLRSSTPELGRGHRYEQDGAPTNSLLVLTASEETRRHNMVKAHKALERALNDVRSARGLVDPSVKPSSSNWTPEDLREAEQRSHDRKRGKRASGR